MNKLIEALPIIKRIVKMGGYEYMTGKEDNIESYWILVRAGFVKNSILYFSSYDWKFTVTHKGYKYLQSMNLED